MKVKSPYSILDAVKNLQRLDASYWRALVSNGIPGAGNHCGARSLDVPAAAERGATAAGARISARHYDHALVDLGRSLNPVALSVIEELDEVYLVTTLEVPAMHRAKHIIQTLFDSGFGKDRLRLILNRVPKRVDVTPEELEKMLGLPAYAMLPNDYPALHDCYSEGKLLGRAATWHSNSPVLRPSWPACRRGAAKRNSRCSDKGK